MTPRSSTNIFVLLTVLCLSICAQAQPTTPQQTLQQYVADLQRSPDDDALREKIIKLALTLPSKPPVSDEVHEAVGRATYAMKNATSEADFLAAAEAFGKASLLAPWVPEYYFDQGIAFEKGKHFDEAITSFHRYLMAAPNSSDADLVRERIGGLKYAKEQMARQRQAAEERRREESSPQAKFEALLKKIEGRRYLCDYRSPYAQPAIYISGRYLEFTSNKDYRDNKGIEITGYELHNHIPMSPGPSWLDETVIISEDGGTITYRSRLHHYQRGDSDYEVRCYPERY